jgi:hypothetical protein
VLEGDPTLAAELLVRTEALASEGDLSVQSRRELEQVHHGVRRSSPAHDRSSERPMPKPALEGLTNSRYKMGLLKEVVPVSVEVEVAVPA